MTAAAGSSLQIKIGTQLAVGPGGSSVPVAAVLDRTAGGTALQFGLDLAPGDPPVRLALGEIIDFVETQIGAGGLGAAANGDAVREALPAVGGDLSPTNTTQVELRTLSFGTSPAGTSFAISVAIVGATAEDPAIGLPADVAGWLSVQQIAVDFAVSAGP